MLRPHNEHNLTSEISQHDSGIRLQSSESSGHSSLRSELGVWVRDHYGSCADITYMRRAPSTHYGMRNARASALCGHCGDSWRAMWRAGPGSQHTGHSVHTRPFVPQNAKTRVATKDETPLTTVHRPHAAHRPHRLPIVQCAGGDTDWIQTCVWLWLARDSLLETQTPRVRPIIPSFASRTRWTGGDRMAGTRKQDAMPTEDCAVQDGCTSRATACHAAAWARAR